MKQEPPVEWLANELKNQFGFVFSNNILDKALEMEKEQIIHAHLTGLIYPLETEASKQAEQYYIETYRNN